MTRDDATHQIKATFDPSSIQVVCARIDGRDDRSTLSKGDKKKIYDNVTKDVLRTRKHPEIRFDSTHVVERGEGFAVEGTLQMYGKSRNIQTSLRARMSRLPSSNSAMLSQILAVVRVAEDAEHGLAFAVCTSAMQSVSILGGNGELSSVRYSAQASAAAAEVAAAAGC